MSSIFLLDSRLWWALAVGLGITILSAPLMGGCELDGAPVSMMVYGLPLWWLKIESATPLHPTFQTVRSFSWVALVIDTLFWSAPGTVPLYLARRWRIRRFRRRIAAGLCGHCGYDLTGNTSGVWPECGNRIGDLAARSGQVA